jgi:hypothetical protein
VPVRIEGGRGGREGGELAAVLRRARQSVCEAAAVGLANRVDAAVVDAIQALDLVDQIRGESKIIDAGDCIGGTLPVPLR